MRALPAGFMIRREVAVKLVYKQHARHALKCRCYRPRMPPRTRRMIGLRLSRYGRYGYRRHLAQFISIESFRLLSSQMLFCHARERPSHVYRSQYFINAAPRH